MVRPDEDRPPRHTYRAGRPGSESVSARLFLIWRPRRAGLLAAMRLPASAAKGRFKKSLSMSGEVGSLAGDRVVSHERSRPADLPQRQDFRPPHAGSYPSDYRGCVSWHALLASHHRRRESVTVDGAFERGNQLLPSAQRHDHIRRNTTLRLFAGISVMTGAENPSDCAIAATASRSRRPQFGLRSRGSGRMLGCSGPLRILRVCTDRRDTAAIPEGVLRPPL